MKLKFITSLTCFLLAGSTLFSQNKLPDLIPIRKGDVWGYCDSAKKMIIPFYKQDNYDTTNTKLNSEYVDACPFNGIVGLVSAFAFTTKIEDVGSLIENRPFLIDKQNRFIKILFNGKQAPHNYFEQKNIKYFSDSITILSMYDEYSGTVKYGFCYKPDGFIDLKYDYLYYLKDLKVFHVKKDGKEGIIDRNGKILLDIKYDNLYFTAQDITMKLNNKYGVLNLDLSEKIPLKYDELFNFQIKYYWVELNGKWGTFDSTGKIMIPVEHNEKYKYFSPKYIKAELNKKQGCMDFFGKILIPFEYDYIGINEKDFAIMVNNKKNSIYDFKTNQITNIPYENCDFDNKEIPVIIVTNKEGKQALMNRNGNCTDFIYELETKGGTNEYFYSSGYAVAKVDGKPCVIRTDGSTLMPPIYDTYSLYPFEKNFTIVVSKNGKYGVIDTLQNIIIPLEYSEIYSFESNNILIVKKNDKMGMINSKNKILLPFEYDEISFCANTIVQVSKNGLFGYVNEKGKLITPCKYEEAENHFTNRLVVVKFKGKSFYIDNKGTEYYIDDGK